MAALRDTPTAGVRRVLASASAHGWTEIAYDAREELQRRVCAGEPV